MEGDLSDTRLAVSGLIDILNEKGAATGGEDRVLSIVEKAIEKWLDAPPSPPASAKREDDPLMAETRQIVRNIIDERLSKATEPEQVIVANQVKKVFMDE